ncbi:MAG: hypothetical protein ACF788_03720 [Novipirellula sp. JB048]
MSESPRDGSEDRCDEWPEPNAGLQDSGEFHVTEQMIRAAGDLISPSDDHRPRTLETARRQCNDLLLEQRVAGLFVGVMLLLWMASPFVDWIREYPSRPRENSSAEIQRKTAEFSQHSGIGPQWATFEVFSQLRQSQANRLQPPQ